MCQAGALVIHQGSVTVSVCSSLICDLFQTTGNWKLSSVNSAKIQQSAPPTLDWVLCRFSLHINLWLLLSYSSKWLLFQSYCTSTLVAVVSSCLHSFLFTLGQPSFLNMWLATSAPVWTKRKWEYLSRESGIFVVRVSELELRLMEYGGGTGFLH
jgi:hypothetical protein